MEIREMVDDSGNKIVVCLDDAGSLFYTVFCKGKGNYDIDLFCTVMGFGGWKADEEQRPAERRTLKHLTLVK